MDIIEFLELQSEILSTATLIKFFNFSVQGFFRSRIAWALKREWRCGAVRRERHNKS